MKAILFLATLSFISLAHGDDSSIDKALVKKVVVKNIEKIKACYEARLDDGLKRSGKLVVRWDIDDTGSAKNFREKMNDLDDRKTYECIVNEMKTWKFPAAPKGESATVDYPFIFSPKP